MIVTRKLKVGDWDVVVRELRVGEVRSWIGGADADDELHPAAAACLALLDLKDPADVQALLGLERATSLRFEQLDGLALSEIRAVVAAVRELNADFFGLLGRASQATRPTSGDASSAPQ